MKGTLFLIILFISTMISPANSKTISVKNLNDAGSGSLREVLSKAAPGDISSPPLEIVDLD